MVFKKQQWNPSRNRGVKRGIAADGAEGVVGAKLTTCGDKTSIDLVPQERDVTPTSPQLPEATIAVEVEHFDDIKETDFGNKTSIDLVPQERDVTPTSPQLSEATIAVEVEHFDDIKEIGFGNKTSIDLVPQERDVTPTSPQLSEATIAVEVEHFDDIKEIGFGNKTSIDLVPQERDVTPTSPQLPEATIAVEVEHIDDIKETDFSNKHSSGLDPKKQRVDGRRRGAEEGNAGAMDIHDEGEILEVSSNACMRCGSVKFVSNVDRSHDCVINKDTSKSFDATSSAFSPLDFASSHDNSMVQVQLTVFQTPLQKQRGSEYVSSIKALDEFRRTTSDSTRLDSTDSSLDNNNATIASTSPHVCDAVMDTPVCRIRANAHPLGKHDLQGENGSICDITTSSPLTTAFISGASSSNIGSDDNLSQSATPPIKRLAVGRLATRRALQLSDLPSAAVSETDVSPVSSAHDSQISVPIRMDTPVDTSTPLVGSVRLKSLNKYFAGSIDFVGKRNKRRKRGFSSLSGRKRRKKISNSKRHEVSTAETAVVCRRQHRHQRYYNSPRFMERLIRQNRDLYYRSRQCRQQKKDRVGIRNLYHLSSPYRQTVKQAARVAVKNKYRQESPFRRATIAAASKRYRKICSSASKLKRLRAEQRSGHIADKEFRSARRKILYKGSDHHQYRAKNKARSRYQLRQQYHGTSNKTYYKMNLNKEGFLEMAVSKQHQGRIPKVRYVRRGTAEYKNLRFFNWKRYKVNQIISMSFDYINQCSTGEDQRSVYALKKLQVQRLLDQILVWQRQQRKVFYSSVARIAAMRSEAEDQIQTLDASEVAVCLETYYGGDRYHVVSHEQRAVSDIPYLYREYVDVFPDQEYLRRQKRMKLLVRPCDESCQSRIPADWGLVLHKRLTLIDDNLLVQDLLLNVHLLENCSSCDLMGGVCAVRDNCTDTILHLLSIQDHYVGLRTLLNHVYEMRAVALELHLIELLLMGGTYKDMDAFKTSRFPDVPLAEDEAEGEIVSIATEHAILTQYGSLVSNFRTGVVQSMEIYECISCLRLVSAKDSSAYDINSDSAFMASTKVVALIDTYNKYFNVKIQVVRFCKPCYKLVVSKDPKQSQYSHANGMWPSPIPSSILCLNAYERQLVSLAKSFQKIVKLHPYRYSGPSSTLTRGIKGLVVHLPLPSGTVPKVTSILEGSVTLPNCDNLTIQVDSLPNLKAHTVFRSLVDMKAVLKALVWLKANNHLYKNVRIDSSFLGSDPRSPFLGPAILFTTNGQENDSDPVTSTSASGTSIKNRKQSYFDTLVDPPENRAQESPPLRPLDGGCQLHQQADSVPDSCDSDMPLGSNIQGSGLDYIGQQAHGEVGGNSGEALKLLDGSCQKDDFVSYDPDSGMRIESNHLRPGSDTIREQGRGLRPLDGGGQLDQPDDSNVRDGGAGWQVAYGGNAACMRLHQEIKARTMKSMVAGLKFPIPYSVPYKNILFDHLKDSSSMLMHVPEQEVLEEYSIIEMEKNVFKTSDLELFAMKPLLSSPLNWDDPYVDVASFPHLFPCGNYGLYHPRGRLVTPAYFCEHRFRMSDHRFRRDLPYLFDCAIRKDMMSMSGSIYTMLHCGKFGNVTAGDIKQGAKDPGKSQTLERNVLTMLGSIPGTPQYWINVRRDLEAVIQEFGSATFFLTLSCAEYRCEDFKEFLILRNYDIPNVQNCDVRSIASLDPVSVSLHFQKKFTVFWDMVLRDPDGPLGYIEHFYIKKEYQQRGAPHMHMLLWVRKAPVHGKAGNEEVLRFITKHISCSVPDILQSPLLHSLVVKNQTHCCTKSCLRTKSVKGRFYCSYCRYGYPREVCDNPRLNTTQQVLEAKVSAHRRIKLYSLERKIGEVNINDYNPAILFMWESNIDIQYIHDESMSLTYYLTFYVTKYEKQQVSNVSQAIDTGLSAAGMARKLMCKLLSSRQLGAHEAADRVLRFPLYRMSENVKFASLYMPGEQRRRLKPKSQVDSLGDDSTDVFCKNFQTTYYPQRPEDLADCCAYEVLQWYEIKYDKLRKPDPLYMDSCNARFAKRQTKAVVRSWHTNAKDQMALERYCFTLLALFKPWRTVDELLTDSDGNSYSTYTEALDAVRDRLPLLQRYESCRKRLRDMIEWAEKIKNDAQKQLEARVEDQQERSAAVLDTGEALDLEVCRQSEVVRGKLTKEMVDEGYEQLNAHQRAAFDRVIEGVKGFDILPFTCDHLTRLFVSGVGGTGKSFLIMALRQHLEYFYSNDKGPSVLVAAPTGVAAINVDGLTIHKLLKLPVAKTRQTGQQFWALHPQDAKILRMMFRNVRLLIIDEVSMLSNIYLLYVHRRLNQILVDEDKDPNARFGNINILLLGDLLQLPPVNAPHVFAKLTAAEQTRYLKAMGSVENLWDCFGFVELTENMRQRDDLVYACMLDRIRIGSPTADDLISLRSRLLDPDIDSDNNWDTLLDVAVQKFVELMEEDPYVLCLMPLNADVSAFNSRVMTLKNLIPFTVNADDLLMDPSGSSRKRRRDKKSDEKMKQLCQRHAQRLNVAETGGLEGELVLAVGARVMLRRNIDVQLKLVNGSVGYIGQVDINPDNNAVNVIHVAFQGNAQLIPISRVTAKYSIGNGLVVQRTQFPLTLAYAITIHKCQGLSLDTALVDIGSGTFANGMAYVALSRVRTLQKLHIIRLDSQRLKCDTRCVKEYNRLLHLAGFDRCIVNYNKNPEYSDWVKKVRISTEFQKDLLNQEMQLASTIGATKVVVKSTTRQKGPVSCLEAGRYLKLSNLDGHSCFGNSVIQCLLRCHHMYPALKQYSGRNALVGHLLSLFDGNQKRHVDVLTLNELRDVFGQQSQFAVTSQLNCDPVDFVAKIMNSLPLSVSQSFKHVYSLRGICDNAVCRAVNVPHEPSESYMLNGIQVSVDKYTFREVFKEQVVQFNRCHSCGRTNPNFSYKVDLIFPTATRYLILNCPIMFGGQRIQQTLLGMRERGMHIFGLKWNIIGCVQAKDQVQLSAQQCQAAEYMEQDDPYRHYVAYVHHNDREWIHLSDSYQNLLKMKPVFKNMVLIFLERAES